MPGLADYETFHFDQGSELRKTYAFNAQLQQGICFSLMIDWTKDLMKNPAGTPASRLKMLNEAFTKAAGRQLIYSSGFTSRSGGTGTLAYDKNTELSSELGRLYGLKFTYKEFGTAVDPFSTAIAKPDYSGKFLYLELSFQSGGAHAIGIRGGTDILVFDPNLGEHSVSTTGTTCQTFSQALWSQYTAWGLVITQWVLREMEGQSTVFDLWKSKA